MLLAYIDEIGETGAFVSRDHHRFNTSPAFGYAGFILPADHARTFGGVFQREKQTLYRNLIEAAAHPGRWERKGAAIFRADTPNKFPAQLRVFDSLVRCARGLGGSLFYYANEKPLGTAAQTRGIMTDAELVTDRETRAMRETLNRIATHAETRGENVMVIIDQINEKTRSARLPVMYSHILGRAAEHQEMRRIVEPPMHVDSVLSANIQFADWIAAGVSRAIDYQLIEDSPHRWITESRAVPAVRGAFTHESKVHLWHKAVPDLHHSDIFRPARPLYPPVSGQRLGGSTDPAVFRKIKAAAERAHSRG